jgi:conjugal transfer pilus assembly protein TraF
MFSNLIKFRAAKVCAGVFFLLSANVANASTENKSWHFYNEEFPRAERPAPPPKPVQEKPEPKEEREPEKEAPKTVVIELEAAPEESTKKPVVEVMGSSAWLAEHLPKIRELAMDNPTKDNVRLYAYFERVAFDKADRFSTVYEQVQKTEPMLNENMRRPTSSAAREVIGDRVRDGMDKATTEILSNNALVFFFEGDCDLCESMAQELTLMDRRYNVTILPVSVDGKPLGSGLFPEFKVDRGQAEIIGIPTYPAVVVYEPENHAWVPIQYGFQGRGALMMTLTEFGVERGWITKEQYAATKTMTYNSLLEVPIEKSDMPEVPDEYVDLFETLVQRNGYE